MVLPGPAALVIAHPGHELRLFRWLELDRPTVFVLTDGSGRSGRSRLSSTLRVIEAAGARAGEIAGRFTDAEIYRDLIEGDVEAVESLTLQLADALRKGGFRSVVADRLEHYNPTHDLCSVIAGLAATHAARPIDCYDYAVTEAASGEVSVELDEDAFRRKLDTAMRYEDLAVDIHELTAKIGAAALRHEALRRIDPERLLPLHEKPYYEVRGEEQVAAGKYERVLRHDRHFVPFVEALAARLQTSTAVS